MESLEDVKHKGYALDDEERLVSPVSDAQIHWQRWQCCKLQSIVSGPTSRMNDGHIDEKIEMVVKTAWEISKISLNVMKI